MWPWAPWSYGKGQDKEKEETKKQPDMAEGQRRPRSRAYYQRSKTEEFPAKASDPIVMDARKLKHPGGARREGVAPHNEQQVGDPDLGEPWEVVEHKDLENLKVVLSLCQVSMIIIIIVYLNRSMYFLYTYITT